MAVAAVVTMAAAVTTGESPHVLKALCIKFVSVQCMAEQLVCKDANLWRALLADMRRVVAVDVSIALTRPARMTCNLQQKLPRIALRGVLWGTCYAAATGS